MIIKILGYEYDLVGTETESTSGECSSFVQRIFISSGQHPEQRESTLIHEVIEAINKMLDLGLDHQQITSLEVGMYSFIRDNELEKLLDTVYDGLD